MQARVVEFVLKFEGGIQRRKLQSSATDAPDDQFESSLRDALVETLPDGVTARNVIIERTDVSGERKVILVELGDDIMERMIVRANSAAFLTALSNILGVEVALVAAARIVWRVTSAPSPPPGLPPNQPLANANFITGDGTFSTEAVWISIGGAVLAIAVIVCAVYWLLKCSRDKLKNVRIGRPELRRSGTVADTMQQDHLENQASGVDLEDVRMIELGMALERVQQARSAVGAARNDSEIGLGIMPQHGHTSSVGSPHRPPYAVNAPRASDVRVMRHSMSEGSMPMDEVSSASVKDLHKRMDDVQTAIALRVIDDVRVIAENLSAHSSPRSPHSPRSPRSSSLEDVFAYPPPPPDRRREIVAPPPLFRAASSQGSHDQPRSSASRDTVTEDEADAEGDDDSRCNILKMPN